MSLQILAYIILSVLSIAIILAFVRLARGPSLPDRVVALDLMTTLGIAVVAAYAIATDQPIFIDVATVVALVSFLATIAFAYYIEKRV
jgi:multicomponent Na+:H+ antiporter subunit F